MVAQAFRPSNNIRAWNLSAYPVIEVIIYLERMTIFEILNQGVSKVPPLSI